MTRSLGIAVLSLLTTKAGVPFGTPAFLSRHRIEMRRHIHRWTLARVGAADLQILPEYCAHTGCRASRRRGGDACILVRDGAGEAHDPVLHRDGDVVPREVLALPERVVLRA